MAKFQKRTDFNEAYDKYINYVESWRNKGYSVTVIEKQFFRAAYETQRILNAETKYQTGKHAGESMAKENVTRQLARQSLDVGYTRARKISSRLNKEYREKIRELKESGATREELSEVEKAPTWEEIKSMTAADAFDLLLGESSTTDDYRDAEAIYYPQRAATRGRGYRGRARR